MTTDESPQTDPTGEMPAAPASRSWRGIITFAALVLAFAAVWLLVPRARALAYLTIGSPLRAWEAALTMPPSDERDQLLRLAMLAPLPTDDVAPITAWQGVLAARFGGDPDSRAPDWVNYGPNGKQVTDFLATLHAWPLGACGRPTPDDPPNSISWRWVAFHADRPDRTAAETDAAGIVTDRLQGLWGTDDYSLQLASAAGHMAGAAAFCVWAGLETLPDRELLEPGRLLRLGHYPVLIMPGQWGCVHDHDVTAPVEGVAPQADGTLLWTDASGKQVVVPSTSWSDGDLESR